MNFVTVEVAVENGSYHARRDGLDLVVAPERGAKAAGQGLVTSAYAPRTWSPVRLAWGEGALGEVYVVEPAGRDDLLDVRVGEASIHAAADPALNFRIGIRSGSIEFQQGPVLR